MDTAMGNSRVQGHPTIPQFRTASKITSSLSGGQTVVLLQSFIMMLMRGWSGGCFTIQLPCSIKQREAPKWFSWWLAALSMSRLGLWTAIWAVLRVPQLIEEKLIIPLLNFPQALCSLGPSLMAQTFASESMCHRNHRRSWMRCYFVLSYLTLLGWSNSHNYSDNLLLWCNKKPLLSKCQEAAAVILLSKACILAPLMYLSRFLLQPL